MAVHLPEAVLGVPGKEPVDLALQQNAWRGKMGVEVDDEEAVDDESGLGMKGGTPAQVHSCRSGVSGYCAHGGCLPLEVIH